MSSKWFTNRGQIIQVIFAGLACFFTGREVISDSIASQPNIWVIAGFLSALAALLILVYRATWSITKPAEPVSLAPSPLGLIDTSKKQMVGGVTTTAVKIRKGDYWDSADTNGFRITLRDIIIHKKRSPSTPEFSVEVQLSGGVFYSLGAASTKQNHNIFLIPYISIPSIRESASVVADYIKDRRCSYTKIYLEHVNTHAQEATLTVIQASFSRPWS